MAIQKQLKQYQNRVTKIIAHLLPSTKKQPKSLHEAMRYAILNGGKRIRASLAYATGEALGADKKIVDHVSAALEMIHAFSLVHDDLPALDNDDLRRGKPSCHKAFDESTAILAGDALQTLAFKTLSNLDKKKISPAVRVEMIDILSHATFELIRGEELDLKMENKKVSLKALKETYKLKTGELLTASILLGALSANCRNKNLLSNLKKFGDYMGLAFQIHDDIIGIESDTKTLGKPKGSDVDRKKPTFPSILGLKKAKEQETALFKKALHYLKKTKLKTGKLASIAEYIIARNF